MTISEVRSAAEAAFVLFDKHFLLHYDSLSKDSDERNGANAKQISDLQNSSDQSSSGVTAFTQILSLCEKARLDLLTTFLEAQTLIMQ